jgi:SAM-dependent methyltransferase
MNAGIPDAGKPAPSLNSEGLLRLGRHLKQAGYRHIAVTPLTHETHNRRPGRERARTLRDVLGWSLPFERTAVAPREFELMHLAGVLEEERGLWRSTVRWSSLDEHLCAHSAYPTHAEDAVFFGPDTYRFARMIRGYLSCNPGHAARIARAADIGCGSGAGALLVADACPRARVEALDINPTALQLARVNAELAGYDAARLPVAHSDLLEDVEGAFDLLIANPPYMLDANERTYRHGGGNLGEGLAQDIVSTALDRLAPGGTLLLYTGVAMVDGEDALLNFITRTLDGKACAWSYEEIDPDVFQDELHKPGYERVERIAAVGLTLTMTGG